VSHREITLPVTRATDMLLVKRCEFLGQPVPTFTKARIALEGHRWTPRQARDLIQLVLDGAVSGVLK
jgi:hypothetical protein